jgi:hypothetical protein
MATQTSLLGTLSTLEGIEDKLYPIRPNPDPQASKILREIVDNITETKGRGGYVTTPQELLDAFFDEWDSSSVRRSAISDFGESKIGRERLLPPQVYHKGKGGYIGSHHFLEFKWPFKGRWKGMTLESMLKSEGGIKQLEKVSKSEELKWAPKSKSGKPKSYRYSKKITVPPGLRVAASKALRFAETRKEFGLLGMLGSSGIDHVVPRSIDLGGWYGWEGSDDVHYGPKNIMGRFRKGEPVLDTLSPETRLYHITDKKNIPSIMRHGLQPYGEVRDPGAFSKMGEAAVPKKRAGSKFGPFFSINEPSMGSLPRAGMKWERAGILEATAGDLERVRALPREEISRILSRSGISGEVQASRAVPPSILKNLRIRGGQLMPLLLVGALASMMMGED